MIKFLTGSGAVTLILYRKKANEAIQTRRTSACCRVLIALVLATSTMTVPDRITSLGLAHATQEDPLGSEIEIGEQPEAGSAQSDPEASQSNQPIAPPSLPNLDANNTQHSCEILVTSSGTIGSSIENKVLSSKLIGGRAGTANITATNSSFSLSIDNPFGFTTMPPGGNAGVVMSASFLGHGKTNFTETPGSHSIEINEGLTMIEAHLIAERTDGNPFPAGYYGAELRLRCE